MPCNNRDRIIRGPIPPMDQWYKYQFPDAFNVPSYDELWDWVEPNTVGSFIHMYTYWSFSDEQDYLMFLLRWAK